MSELAFKVEEKLANEKAKAIRRNGQTPGVIYGEFLDNPISIKIANTQLPKILKTHLTSSVVPLEVNNDVKNCVIKDIQKDMYGKIIHVDFQYVKANEVIKLKVPVTFEGQGALETNRLVLETFASEIEVQGAVEKLPEKIDIDVSDKKFENKILAKDVTLPEGVHLVTAEDTLLAVVAGTQTEEESEEETEEKTE
ncbi:MAG: 50S ribosomal protein L25 [Clostridium sp.]|nr:50S ribosomal protein L25 [Clostridium sp.]